MPSSKPTRRPWLEELKIIDKLMKDVSRATEPEDMIDIYYDGIAELFPMEDYVALSRRGVSFPEYIVTRSSRFPEFIDPWKERHRLPRFTTGLLGELAYANAPVLIEDLPSRLKPNDPGYFYLEGFQSLMSLPQYENGEATNISIALFKPGVEWDRTMVPTMHWQSSLFGRGTYNIVLRKQLEEAIGALDRELQVVGQIQRSLLPQELPRISGFEVAAHYETSARAGGDYYDFFPLSDHEHGLFIADVSGHGTPAAVLMAITHAIAHSRPGTHKPPANVLADINRHLAQTYTTAGTFVTAFYAVLDSKRCEITYACAGHNPPRLRKKDGVVPVLGAASLPLGIDPEERYTEQTLPLCKGDMLLLYTDGIVEAMAPASKNSFIELFGYERLDETLARTENPSDAIDAIRRAVASFTENAAPNDDRTLVALRCEP